VRIWAQLLYPLELKNVGQLWLIVIKGTDKNVMHNDAGVFVVYTDEAAARDAYEKVKWIRKNVKYLRKIRVEV